MPAGWIRRLSTEPSHAKHKIEIATADGMSPNPEIGKNDGEREREGKKERGCRGRREPWGKRKEQSVGGIGKDE